MKKIKRQVKGITLMALVVTIIMLLILAGVSISIWIGEGKILDNTKETTEKSKIAQYEEEIFYILSEERIDRTTNKKEESFVTSVKLKIEKRDWVSKVIVYNEKGEEQVEEYIDGNIQLVIETKNEYKIIVGIDDKNNIIEIKTENLIKEEQNYTIIYDANGATNGTVEGHTNCKKGDYIILKENGYTKDGYEFCGWSKVKDINDEKDIILAGTSVRVEGDETYYAVWKLKDIVGKTLKYKEYNWKIYGTNADGRLLAKPVGTCGSLSFGSSEKVIEYINLNFGIEGKVEAKLFDFNRRGRKNITIIWNFKK